LPALCPLGKGAREARETTRVEERAKIFGERAKSGQRAGKERARAGKKITSFWEDSGALRFFRFCLPRLVECVRCVSKSKHKGIPESSKLIFS
jgi:hypothetical protein